MSEELYKKMEERISSLEFKQELLLKILKKYTNNGVATDVKTMEEFAYINHLSKEGYDQLNQSLVKQIEVFQVYKQQPYLFPRQQFSDLNLIVLEAFSKDEYEQLVWSCMPHLKGNQKVCETVAKINGIYDLYYDMLASEIQKFKHAKMDKEKKLRLLYTTHKEEVDNLYHEIELVNNEFQLNIEKINQIISFFEEKGLRQISLFYNGELWDKNDDEKQVVINNESYIHNVCVTTKHGIIRRIDDIINSKTIEYKDLIVSLMKSSVAKKMADLNTLYKTMNEANTSKQVIFTELITLKEKIQSQMPIVNDLITTYKEYINTKE